MTERFRPNKLAASYIQRRIEDLEAGESAYTVPWALSINEHGHGYLDESFVTHPMKCGTVCMLVTRVAGGYTVECSGGAYQWTVANDANGAPVEFIGELGAS